MQRLGITGRAGYFASRAAPMGAVAAELVVATFFNFNPDLVRAAIPGAWDITSPRRTRDRSLLPQSTVRSAVCSGTMCSSLGPWPERPNWRVGLAETAGTQVEGRPLSAGHADLPWPDLPHLVLWHAQSILREFRGDGHVALLLTHGLSGIDALVTHAAAGDVASDILRSTRGWSEEQWGAAVSSLQERGWLAEGDDVAFTEWGAAQRQEIEDQTDILAAAPYAALGDEGCAELRTLTRPWSTTFAELLFR